MTPYYEDDQVTLYHGDCLPELAAMPDRHVDVVITDPPYDNRTHSMARTNKGRGHGGRAIDFTCWDHDMQTALPTDDPCGCRAAHREHNRAADYERAERSAS